MAAGREYQAHCSCGWTSRWHGSLDDAQLEGLQHVPPVQHHIYVEGRSPTVEELAGK